MKLKAYAKINLSLKILGKRPDGYHEIESVMQSVSLHDVITLEPIPSGIQLQTSNIQLPNDRRNLAYEAAELYLKGKGGVKIHIEKNIPLAAGLAGGSTDAAAVLLGLNNTLSNDDLLKLGEEIGSDVPFCLTGGTCLVKGRGETVTRLSGYPESQYVIVVPDLEVSSKWAYDAYDQMTNDKSASGGQMSNEGINNDLEPVVIDKYPVIQEIKDQLVELGCEFAQMSGSGPSVFGKCSSNGEKILSAMKKQYPQSFLVKTV